MGVEGDDYRGEVFGAGSIYFALLPSARDETAEDFLMAEVDAVEIADGDDRARNFVDPDAVGLPVGEGLTGDEAHPMCDSMWDSRTRPS